MTSLKILAITNVKYDRIDGLQESSEVTLNGYKVGQVRKISLPINSVGS